MLTWRSFVDGNACLHGDRLWTVMHAYMEIVCGR